MEKTPGHGELGRKTACSTKKIEVLSNKIKRNHLLRYTPSLLYLEINCVGIWRSSSRKFLRHLDHCRRLPTKIIGRAIWIQILLEAAKIPNESNQNPIKIPDKSPQRKSRIVLCLIARRGSESTKRCVVTPTHIEEDPYWRIKKRSTKLISEYQDCHMQL